MRKGGLRSPRWQLGACPSCGGDLYRDVLDEGWFVCLLCARSFSVGHIQTLVAARNRDRPPAAGRRSSGPDVA